MAGFDEFIASETAAGRMSKYVIATSPDGVDVLYWIDPLGSGGGSAGTGAIPYLRGAMIRDGEVFIIRSGPGLTEDSELNLVLTPQGMQVEYEFYRGGIYGTIVGPVDDFGTPLQTSVGPLSDYCLLYTSPSPRDA